MDYHFFDKYFDLTLLVPKERLKNLIKEPYPLDLGLSIDEKIEFAMLKRTQSLDFPEFKEFIVKPDIKGFENTAFLESRHTFLWNDKSTEAFGENLESKDQFLPYLQAYSSIIDAESAILQMNFYRRDKWISFGYAGWNKHNPDVLCINNVSLTVGGADEFDIMERVEEEIAPEFIKLVQTHDEHEFIYFFGLVLRKYGIFLDIYYDFKFL